MEQSWYYTRGGQQQGPVDKSELKRLAASNELGASDLVWTDGLENWMPVGAVPDLLTPPAAVKQSVAASISQATVDPRAAAPRGMAAGGFSGSPLIDYASIGGERVGFAGFFVRFLASFVDGLIVLIMCFSLAAAFIWFVGDEAVRANAGTVGLFIRIVFVVVAWIYFASLESSPRQSTLGKRLLGLRVTDLSGQPISFGRASARHFAKILSQIIFCLGYIMMKFNPNSQCLHDMIAGCVVVKREWR